MLGLTETNWRYITQCIIEEKSSLLQDCNGVIAEKARKIAPLFTSCKHFGKKFDELRKLKEAYQKNIDALKTLQIPKMLTLPLPHYLIKCGNFENFELYLKAGNINCRNRQGATPLHAAASLNKLNFVKLILSYPNVDCQARTKKSKLAEELTEDPLIKMAIQAYSRPQQNLLLSAK